MGLLQNYSEFCNTILLTRSSCGGTPQSAGVGRERMWKKFAGYIPANRAEKFREVERRWAKLPAFEGTFADFPQKLVRARQCPLLIKSRQVTRAGCSCQTSKGFPKGECNPTLGCASDIIVSRYMCHARCLIVAFTVMLKRFVWA